MRRLVRRDDVERRIVERQARGVTHQEADVGAPSGRLSGQTNLLRIHIDPRHVESVLRCKVHRGHSVPAADVKVLQTRQVGHDGQPLFHRLRHLLAVTGGIDEPLFQSPHLHDCTSILTSCSWPR